MRGSATTYEPFDWRALPDDVVIGVDEVGRGCLAGPVYAAAVRMRPESGPSAVTDSKLLSASRRDELSEIILRDHEVGIGLASVDEISSLNILQASLLAMRRAVEKLGYSSGHLLIDGNQKIPGLSAFRQTTLIKGDLRAEPIAAASIVAKVARDRLLTELALSYPQYGFDQHKGYSTEAHKAAIAKHGPCPVHRPTFAGVREHLAARLERRNQGDPPL